MKTAFVLLPLGALAALTGNHSVMLWAVYTLGQFLHTATKADAAADVAIAKGATYREGFRAYLFKNRRQIIARKFLGFCMFPIVWDNPSLVGLTELFEKIGPAALVGAGGILGWFSDSVGDKVFSRFFKDVPIDPPSEA